MNKIILPTILLLSIITIIGISTVYADEHETIPSWIKVVAGAWYEDKITDSEYRDAMTFLIEYEIIVIPGYGKIADIDIPEIRDDDELGITTDKDSYIYGETMHISGTLPDYGSDTIVLQIINPDNEMVSMFTIVSDGKGNFSKDLKLEIPSMLQTAKYVIQCKYQGETVEIEFEYSSKPLFGSQLTVEIDKQSYDEYEIMHISGTVPIHKITSVYLTFVWPNDVVAEIGYVQVQEDYTYSLDRELHGQMNESGDYTLQVTYYRETVETPFEYEEYEEPEVPNPYEITVTTDKASYVANENIVVSGTVTSTLDDITSKQVRVYVLAPNGNVVSIEQSDVNEDGSFSTSMSSGGMLWKEAGTHTVLVAYDNEKVEITFEYSLLP